MNNLHGYSTTVINVLGSTSTDGADQPKRRKKSRWE